MLPDATTALLVIDAQESFRHRPYFEEDELDSYLLNQQALITGAQQAGIPVVQVLHVEPEGAFSEASGLVRTLAPLKLSPEFVVRKERHSALVGSGLDVWLVQQGVQRLIISGIRTEQCCETTTRHASDLGYQVDFCTEATATFPMIDKAGHRWSSAEIKARSELVLEGRFARIVTVREALAVTGQPEAA